MKYLSTSLQAHALKLRTRYINRFKEVAKERIVLFREFAEITIVNVRGEECMGNILAHSIHLLHNHFLGVQEVDTNEGNSRINPVVYWWLARSDDDSGPAR